MQGTVEHYHAEEELSKFHSYRTIRAATKGKRNGLQPDEPALALEPPSDSESQEEL